MEPIRILHVFGGLDSGGAESRTMDIYRNIDKKKVQFDFLIHTNKNGFFDSEIVKMGGRIYRVPRLGLKTLFAYPRSIKSFFRMHSEYKIIHGHMLSTAFIYLKIAKEYGVPIRIAHTRNSKRTQKDLVSKIKNVTEKLSSLYATHKFAVSKLAASDAFGKKSVKNGDVEIIPNAIESQKYSFNQNKRNKLREQLNLNDHLVIGHIGRFTPQKNHFFLLDVFFNVKKNHGKSKLILVGDGPMKPQIEEKIAELGLEKSVFLLGIRNDVNDLLQTFDVLFFPSTHEGLPGVVLEAQAAGLPSVLSNVITNEVEVTDLIRFLSLNQNIDTWTNELINFGKEKTRLNTHDKMVKAGYDIETVAKWYQVFYLEQFKNKTN